MTTSTTTSQRDPGKAREALARDFGTSDPRDVVQYLGNAPVRSANAILAAWGIPAFTETGEFQGLLRQQPYTARSTVDGFIEFVDSYIETKQIEADPDLLAAIAEVEAEKDEPECYTGDGTIDQFSGPPAGSEPEQMQLPGVDWSKYEGTSFDDPHEAAHDVEDAVASATDQAGSRERSALLLAEGIVVLRKVGKGKVKGGYSLTVGDLRQAILNTDLSADEIAARIQAAK